MQDFYFFMWGAHGQNLTEFEVIWQKLEIILELLQI